MDERRREDVAPEHPSLTVRELAVLLGLSESTIRRMLHKGLLTGRREGRTWRIDAEAVRSHKQPQTSGASDREPPNFWGKQRAALGHQAAGTQRGTRPAVENDDVGMARHGHGQDLCSRTRGLAGRRAVSLFLHNHWLSAGWYRESCSRPGRGLRPGRLHSA